MWPIGSNPTLPEQQPPQLFIVQERPALESSEKTSSETADPKEGETGESEGRFTILSCPS